MSRLPIKENIDDEVAGLEVNIEGAEADAAAKRGDNRTKRTSRTSASKNLDVPDLDGLDDIDVSDDEDETDDGRQR